MLPVVSTRPLWWLARWAARLLTGFAVAAAFTLGAWAMPAHAASLADLPAGGPAWQFTVAGPAQSPADVLASPTADGCAAIQPTAGPWQGDSDDRPGTVPATTPTSPTSPRRDAAPGITAAPDSSPATVTPGTRSARAPPRH